MPLKFQYLSLVPTSSLLLFLLLFNTLSDHKSILSANTTNSIGSEIIKQNWSVPNCSEGKIQSQNAKCENASGRSHILLVNPESVGFGLGKVD